MTSIQRAVLMVEALYLAATQDKEPAVADYLEAQLAARNPDVDASLQQQFQLLSEVSLPVVDVHQHDLSRRMTNSSCPLPPNESLPEPQSPPQTPPPPPYAQPLGNPGTTSHAGAVELRSILAGTLRIGGDTGVGACASNAPSKRLNSPSQKRFPTLSGTHLPNLNPAPLMQLSTDTGWLAAGRKLLDFWPLRRGQNPSGRCCCPCRR